jgi:carbon monoxide dehydrogenase subunit G
MNIEGTYTLQAPPRIVWQRLKDKELLQRAFPGLVRFEPAGDDAYEIALQVTSSPLNGTYYGLASVESTSRPGPGIPVQDEFSIPSMKGQLNHVKTYQLE